MTEVKVNKSPFSKPCPALLTVIVWGVDVDAIVKVAPVTGVSNGVIS